MDGPGVAAGRGVVMPKPCLYCGATICTRAATCPESGLRQPRPINVALVVALACLALVVVLGLCYLFALVPW
jgi:hypothetical protein